MGERDTTAGQADVAAAHLEVILVDPQGDVHEGEGSEEDQQPGGDAPDDGHDERSRAGGPRRVDRELDAERHAGRADERQQPLDPVGRTAGPDVRMRDVGMRGRGVLAVAVVPHAYESTQVSLRW